MKTQEIVINNCYGGFGLSTKAITEYAKLKGKKVYFYIPVELGKSYSRIDPEQIDDKKELLIFSLYIGNNPTEKEFNNAKWFSYYNIKRNDPDLIKVVKKLGKKANGNFAHLKIVSIPANIKWKIEEYDGTEWVAEQHRTWN